MLFRSVEQKSLPSPVPEGTEAPQAEEPTAGDKLKQPPFLFRNAQGLINMTQQHNVRFSPSEVEAEANRRLFCSSRLPSCACSFFARSSVICAYERFNAGSGTTNEAT